MPEHTVHTAADVPGFVELLLQFLAGEPVDLDVAFEDVRMDAAASTWSVRGVVRGAYRVTPIGAPAHTRHPALGARLVVDVDGAGGGTRASVETGAGHLRVVADEPEVVIGALPLTGGAASVARAMADAGIPIQVHGPAGLTGTLDRDGRALVADPP